MTMTLIYDVETCGFPNDRLPDDHPSQPPLVQLGAILVDEDNGAEFATLELIVRPNGWVIPDSAARIHGITTALALAAGVPLSLVVPAFVQLRAKASRIVCHNAEFDQKMMRQAIARNGKPVTLAGPSDVYCTMEASTPLLKLPASDRMKAAGRGGQFKNPKLSEAHELLLGCGFDGAHSALADARAAARVYFEIKRRTADTADSGQGVIAIDLPPKPEPAKSKDEEPAFVTEARWDGAVV